MRSALLAVVITGLLHRKQNPQVDYSINPAIPEENEALAIASQASNAAALASSEAYTAAAARESSIAAAKSAEAALKSFAARADTEAKVDAATAEAAKAAASAKDAEAAAQEARELAEAIPAKVQAAAERATKEVISSAVAELKAQASSVKEAIRARHVAAQEAAVTAVADAGVPYRAAELRQKKFAHDHVVEARDFAQAVIPLKTESLKIMVEAQKYQASGNVVVAQEMAIKAHDLMDKAMQMQKHAEGLHATANSIQGNMGLYDLAAKQAEDYAAYVANPVGDPPPIPPLPAGLQ